jgi:hypothetical protein
MNPSNTARAVGLFLGSLHAIWGCMVWFEIAQPILDFILQLHSLQIPVCVQPFNLINSLILVTITTAVGYFYGFLFALLGNRCLNL